MKKNIILIVVLHVFLVGFSQTTLDYTSINRINKNNRLVKLYEAEALDSIVTTIDFLGNQFMGQRNVYEYRSFGKVSHEQNYTDDMLNDLMNTPSPEGKKDREMELTSDIKYIYDEAHVLQETIKSEIDSLSGELTYTEKKILSYDDNDNVSYTMNYTWDKENETWILSGKTEMTYNDNNQLTEKEDYELLENEEFFLIYVTTYTINEDEDITLTLEKEWSDAAQSLLNKKKTEYVYVSQHTIEYMIDYEYSDAMEWAPTRKIDFEYGDNGDVHQMITYKRDEDGQAWENNLKIILFFDDNTPLEDVIIPLDMGEIYNYVHHKVLKMDLYKHVPFLGFQNMGVTDYFYNIMEVPVAENLSPDYKMYPNPVNDFIHIDIKNEKFEGVLEIINLSGKVVLKKNVHAQSVISAKGLTEGMYLYRLHHDKDVYSGKFLKEK